jgi:hypothetical protein
MYIFMITNVGGKGGGVGYSCVGMQIGNSILEYDVLIGWLTAQSWFFYIAEL